MSRTLRRQCKDDRVRLVAAIVALAVVAASGTVRAETSANTENFGPTWKVAWELDLPILALESVVGLGWLGQSGPPPHCAPLCDVSDVWAIDRGTAGNWSPTFARMSDVGFLALLVGSMSTLAFDEGLAAAATDALVVLEAAGGAMAVAALVSGATRRPRPFVYGEAAPLEDRTATRAAYSFPSGHTAGAFGFATATFRTLIERHADRTWPYWALGIGLAGAGTVATGRVLAGQHFPTDVVAGAIVGIAVGYLVPSAHASRVRVLPHLSATEASAGFELAGAF